MRRIADPRQLSALEGARLEEDGGSPFAQINPLEGALVPGGLAGASLGQADEVQSVRRDPGLLSCR